MLEYAAEPILVLTQRVVLCLSVCL